MKVLGKTFDCYKKMDYPFDLVIEVQKRGKDRFGVVKKSRIEAFEELESFKFSFEELSKRYGLEQIQRDPTPEKLATVEQVERMKHLVEVLQIPEETIDKWLDKAQASSYDEMSETNIAACIKSLEERINPKQGAR